MKKKRLTHRKTRVVVITGTPGTGKTTFSKALADRIGANYLSLTQLVVRNHLHAATDPYRRSKIIDLERTRAFLTNFLSDRDKPTVVDTHVPDAVPRLLVSKAIVLRSHPKVLERRLHRKGWSARKIRENVLAEILDACYSVAYCYYGAKKVAQIDTSRGGVSTCVSQGEAVLTKEVPERVVVDWIGTLKREQRMEDYLT